MAVFSFSTPATRRGSTPATSRATLRVSPTKTGFRNREDCSRKATMESLMAGGRVGGPTAALPPTRHPRHHQAVGHRAAEPGLLAILLVVVEGVVVPGHAGEEEEMGVGHGPGG